MQTHRNFLFLVVPLLFIIILFSLTNIFYLALSQSEFDLYIIALLRDVFHIGLVIGPRPAVLA
jgi:hypothetical protein